MDTSSFYARVDQFLEAKDLSGAEKYMKDSLCQAEETGDDTLAVSVCNELGGLYRALSRYDEGIPLYEKALAAISRLGLDGSEHHGTTLVNYATTCAMTGRTQEALRLETEAASIFSAAGLAQDYRLATLYNNMSFLCLDLNKPEEAETYLLKALDILHVLEDSEIDIAVTYSNLAGVYLSMEKPEEASESAEKAVAQFQNAGAEEDVHYAGAVSSLGAVRYRQGRFEEAASLMKEALQLTCRDYGSDTQNYAILCGNLADCLDRLGRQEEAEDCRRKAKAVLERIGL